MNIDIHTIKLVVWDLDDTLWTGTLSEGDVSLPDSTKNLILSLTDAGIINSICSKNDIEPVREKLQYLGLWDYFVFPSVNWDNKGLRLKTLIDQMALRPQNVLFIDDNSFNLQEAHYTLPSLQVADPSVLTELIEQVKSLPVDEFHKRLKQYKVLEQKAEAVKSYNSNEDFLYASNIRVIMHTDCMSQLNRIHELILRSNQLNFTKKRISIEELSTLLQNPEYKCGYVSVTDNYGDYGIVGFYALTNNRLEHFVFSCRTMGQMIEQYVYAQLGFPELEVVGEVRTNLNKSVIPQWINQSKPIDKNKKVESETLSCRVLLKGPCDLSHSQSYIHSNGQIVSEFTYVRNDGLVVDTYNHSVHIRGLHDNSDDDKAQLIADCPFVDPAMLHGTFFSGDYNVIFMSSLLEGAYPIYQKKGSTLQVVYNGSLSAEQEEAFLSKYEYVGFTTADQFRLFLSDALSWLPQKTTLCIILGATLSLQGNEEQVQRHKAINRVVKALAQQNNRLRYIDVDEFVRTRNDVTDSLNHYQTRVYYEIGQAMIRVIKDATGHSMQGYNRGTVVFDSILVGIRNVVKRHIRQQSRLYGMLKHVYLRLARRQDNISSNNKE